MATMVAVHFLAAEPYALRYSLLPGAGVLGASVAAEEGKVV